MEITMATIKMLSAQPGERTDPTGKPVRNKPFLAVPDEEFHAIRPHLQFVNYLHHLSL